MKIWEKFKRKKIFCAEFLFQNLKSSGFKKDLLQVFTVFRVWRFSKKDINKSCLKTLSKDDSWEQDKEDFSFKRFIQESCHARDLRLKKEELD